MKTDIARHNDKIISFTNAVALVGFSRVEKVVGVIPAAKLELARDAHYRRQHVDIVAKYLHEAQEEFDNIHGFDDMEELDLYKIMSLIS